MLAALIFAAVTAAAGGNTPIIAGPADVQEAIVLAVHARMARPHQPIEVSVEGLRIHGGPAARDLRATPDAGSRVGGPMRFILHAGPFGGGRERAGSADAVVHVRARIARATRALGAGTIVAPGDVATVAGDPGRVPLLPFPSADALIGARLRRAVPAGGAIAGDAVTAAPLVRSGDEVAIVVRVGPVLAQGRATALDDGALGAVVRLQIEKRRLRGRVSAAGEVEITP